MASSIRTILHPSGLLVLGLILLIFSDAVMAQSLIQTRSAVTGRERTSLNAGWRFARFTTNPDSLTYETLKPWMLPAANEFLDAPKYERPTGEAPGAKVNYVQSNFDDKAWEQVTLPHDWAITGTFDAPGVGGGQGRLPINGVGWYRRTLLLDRSLIVSRKSIYVDIDGAMAYAAVWLNGQLVGGWPFGYNSFRLDLTPFAQSGENMLAIRLDNALESSRWYPGAGIYRNVWLVTADPVHVGHFGTSITTPSVSAQEATVRLVVDVENKGDDIRVVDVVTKVYELDAVSRKPTGDAVATFPSASISVPGQAKRSTNSTVVIKNP